MTLDESPRHQTVGSKRFIGGALGGRPRHQHQCLVARHGVDADPAQRIQVGLDRVPRGCARQAIEMGEGVAPPTAGVVPLAGYGIAWTQDARERGAARVLGQVDCKIVVAAAQRAHQLPLGNELLAKPLVLPFAIDGVQLRDLRMVTEHRRGFLIDERIDLEMRCGALQDCKYR